MWRQILPLQVCCVGFVEKWCYKVVTEQLWKMAYMFMQVKVYNQCENMKTWNIAYEYARSGKSTITSVATAVKGKLCFA